MIGLGLGITQQRRRRGAAFDPDAAAYITAVETADGQALEDGVKTAINNFVVGCKADGIWDALKASCILAGARTLNGCLVPLTGAAPTNFNFVTADYNRKTGLKGDGSTKYLDSNRAGNADPQNDFHLSVFVEFAGTKNETFIGVNDANSSSKSIERLPNQAAGRALNETPYFIDGGSTTLGFRALSRNAPASYSVRVGGVDYAFSETSNPPNIQRIHVFAKTNDNDQTARSFVDARITFYSAGSSINSAALDTRVTNLVTALDGAIT